MTMGIKLLKTMRVRPNLPPALKRLEELAYNLWWCWNTEGVELFRRLSDELWEETYHNPVALLGRIPQEKLLAAAEDDAFRAFYARVLRHFDDYLQAGNPSADPERMPMNTWYRSRHAAENAGCTIAYFSMEFGLTEALQSYSGGLGLLAGDHLKSASDLGLPLTGVGLLYREGYFRQNLNQDGWQQEFYSPLDFYNLPLQLVAGADGKPLRVSVPDGKSTFTVQVWQVLVGRVTLLLLDANLPENPEPVRALTAQLYGGDTELRIRQEVLLGIGGYRALLASGRTPTFCHMNEGHSAFLALAQIRHLMQERKLGFDEARLAAQARTLFTTHTPVPAGIDRFPLAMVEKYLAPYCEQRGLPLARVLALGKSPLADEKNDFNMAVFALRTSAYRNGVSKLHGEVSRLMFDEVWPSAQTDEVPIGHITNGVHVRSWVSGELGGLYHRYLGPGWISHTAKADVWARVERIPGEELWRAHERRRQRLVSFARKRLAAQTEAKHGLNTEVASAGEALRPDILTIGFARRFATYKRANLLFRDVERLKRIVSGDPARPVQIIIAGKAHPKDNLGKELIKQIVHLQREPELRGRIVFIEDYDICVARYLVSGADVWLNNPRRPLEASGTSGMKAAANGVLNLSVLDGWWDEGYRQGAGWAIGDRSEHLEPAELERQDDIDANALYDLLEKEVVPTFYTRGADGLPRQWLEMMKSCLCHLVPAFNTDRMVEEYCQQFYLPGHQRGSALLGQAALLGELARWQEKVRAAWPQVKVKSVAVSGGAEAEYAVGLEHEVSIVLQTGGLPPAELAVELVCGPLDSRGEVVRGAALPMTAGAVADGGVAYRGTFRFTESGRHGIGVRVLPRHAQDLNPFETGLIAWA